MKRASLFVDCVARITRSALKTTPLSAQYNYGCWAHKGYPVFSADPEPDVETPIDLTCFIITHSGLIIHTVLLCCRAEDFLEAVYISVTTLHSSVIIYTIIILN